MEKGKFLAGHVCTKMLKASVLLLTVPPLLLSSVCTEMAAILQGQATGSLVYGISEQTAAIELEATAAESTELAVADQTEAEILEAKAAELKGISTAEEEEAMVQQEKDAGLDAMKPESGEAAAMEEEVAEAAEEATQVAETSETAEITEAAEAAEATEAEAAEAAEATEAEAAGVDSAAETVAVGTEEAAEAGEVVAATEGAAAESAAATAEVTAAMGSVEGTAGVAEAAAIATAESTAVAGVAEGSALAVAEGSAFASVEGSALAAGSALGPAGLAAAAGTVAVIAEAPKIAAEASALNAEVQADSAELSAVEHEAQAYSEEAAALTEQAGAESAEAASVASMAIAMAAVASSMLLQLIAFALQAPVAIFVFSAKSMDLLSSVQPVMASKEGMGHPSTVITNFLLFPTALAILIQPWAESVGLAASLIRLQEEPLQQISRIPGLQLFFNENKTADSIRNTSHAAEDRRLDASTGRFLHSSAKLETLELWPDWDAFSSGLGNSLQTVGSTINTVKDKADDVAEKAGEQIKDTAAGKAIIATGDKVADIAGQAGEQLKETVKDIRNGNADIGTTTVAPYTTPAPPQNPDDHWTVFKVAFGQKLTAWSSCLLGFLEDSLLVIAIVTLSELIVGMGRHFPKLRNGQSHLALAVELALDVYKRLVGVLAVIGALWVLSLVLAKHFETPAKSVRARLEDASWFHQGLTIALSCALFFSCAFQAKVLSAVPDLDEKNLYTGVRDASCKLQAVDVQEAHMKYAQLMPSNESETNLGEAVENADLPSWQQHGMTGTDSASDASKTWVESLCRGAASFVVFLSFAIDELLLVLERPVASWAAGATLQSFLSSQLALSLLPWGLVAPTFFGYKPSSPYELLIPFAFLGVFFGYLLVVSRRAAEKKLATAG